MNGCVFILTILTNLLYLTHEELLSILDNNAFVSFADLAT